MLYYQHPKGSKVMFIGHLPAGYILSNIARERALNICAWKFVLLTGLIGSVIPDIDLIYFYLIDGRQTHHHSYITHTPFFWLIIYLTSTTLSILFKNKKALYLTGIFTASVLTHLLLDSITGKIYWGYPFSNEHLTLVDVEAKHSWWVMNFVLHWTFIFELLLFTASIIIFKLKNRFRGNNT